MAWFVVWVAPFLPHRPKRVETLYRLNAEVSLPVLMNHQTGGSSSGSGLIADYERDGYKQFAFSLMPLDY
jgi:hypothetical protein